MIPPLSPTTIRTAVLIPIPCTECRGEGFFDASDFSDETVPCELCDGEGFHEEEMAVEELTDAQMQEHLTAEERQYWHAAWGAEEQGAREAIEALDALEEAVLALKKGALRAA